MLAGWWWGWHRASRLVIDRFPGAVRAEEVYEIGDRGPGAIGADVWYAGDGEQSHSVGITVIVGSDLRFADDPCVRPLR
jgi:hypothetical protein